MAYRNIFLNGRLNLKMQKFKPLLKKPQSIACFWATGTKICFQKLRNSPLCLKAFSFIYNTRLDNGVNRVQISQKLMGKSKKKHGRIRVPSGSRFQKVSGKIHFLKVRDSFWIAKAIFLVCKNGSAARLLAKPCVKLLLGFRVFFFF